MFGCQEFALGQNDVIICFWVYLERMLCIIFLVRRHPQLCITCACAYIRLDNDRFTYKMPKDKVKARTLAELVGFVAADAHFGGSATWLRKRRTWKINDHYRTWPDQTLSDLIRGARCVFKGMRSAELVRMFRAYWKSYKHRETVRCREKAPKHQRGFCGGGSNAEASAHLPVHCAREIGWGLISSPFACTLDGRLASQIPFWLVFACVSTCLLLVQVSWNFLSCGRSVRETFAYRNCVVIHFDLLKRFEIFPWKEIKHDSNPKRVPEARLKMWVPYRQAFLAFLVVKCAGDCWSSFRKCLFWTRSQHHSQPCLISTPVTKLSPIRTTEFLHF